MENTHKPYGPYEQFIKRPLDFILSLAALVILSPVLLALTIIGMIAMKGNPFFVQKRPGRIDEGTRQEKIFSLVKFRTMSNARDEKGCLLPDEERLTGFGKWLRSTSLDELPELWNILKGDMSLIGPRPQLVRDMVFMTVAQRERHVVLPGLTGLAQVNGRNNISWEDKLKLDLQYVRHITFRTDVVILMKTVYKIFKRLDIQQDGMATGEDYGDYLLDCGRISRETYDAGQRVAKQILMGVEKV